MTRTIGLHVALACHGVYLLWYVILSSLILFISNTLYPRNRGLRNSRSRQGMLIIVLLMLASDTTHVFLNLQFYIVQLPTIGIPGMPPDVLQKMVLFEIGESWLIRMNVRIMYNAILSYY